MASILSYRGQLFLKILSNMKLLWLFVLLPAVLGQGFGRSHLKYSRLCHQWTCINTKLGLPDSLPPQRQSEEVLRRVLPEGPWQDVVDKVLENCYFNRTRRFTNTCPGQALLHCVVDQMIDNCPEDSLVKDDSCSPVSSIAGFKYMFTQSRYYNLEKNLPKEQRPSWFLKNYFDTKCCDLPVMFNRTVLEKCGFSSFIDYFIHGPKYKDVQTVDFKNYTTPSSTTSANNEDPLKMKLNQLSNSNDMTDPLDCCDLTQFIQPLWRSECDFNLSWGGQDRLVIGNQTRVSTEAPVMTTTEKVEEVKDLMLLPQSCEKEECVFRKLGIINESGFLDIDAYMKMLHNFTNAHPSWAKAKARVVTKCLVKTTPRNNYDAGCEINNILSCTFDVLTENCPYTKKSKMCRHGKHEVGCQISSSKYRPKNRREICLLPELIHHDHLSECGLESLYRAEHITVTTKPRIHDWFASKFECKDSTASTTCLMNKMGILNKYSFMDYFKMKDKIRQFTSDQIEWAALLELYTRAFTDIPMYAEHCNSQKKLLNVIDAMIMTCPVPKRKNTTQCNKIFVEMRNTAPADNRNITRQERDDILKRYLPIFMPNHTFSPKPDRVSRRRHSKTKKPIFDFGFLNSKDVPPVKVIDVKPVSTSSRPLVLRPVYLQPSFARGPFKNDGIWRNNPFWLHDQIAKSHTSTPAAPTAHTISTINNNVYSTRPLITPTVTIPTFTKPVTDFPIEMLKPE